MNIHDSKPKAEGTGKIFMTGRSQAVRLPKEFRLPGSEVKITRQGDGLFIEPKQKKKMTTAEWFAELDKYADLPFMEDGRDQPPMPPDKDIFGDDND